MDARKSQLEQLQLATKEKQLALVNKDDEMILFWNEEIKLLKSQLRQ